jgi:uncharacterized protein YkwD
MRRTPPIFAGVLTLALLTAFPVSANYSADVVDSINQVRKSSGRSALPVNAELSKAAQKHAEELVQRGYGTQLKSGGHKGKNGSGVRQRAGRAGFKACYIVENIAWGQKTPSALVTQWLNSSGHKKNLLDRKIKAIGVGFAAPKTWVFVGAKEC